MFKEFKKIFLISSLICLVFACQSNPNPSLPPSQSTPSSEPTPMPSVASSPIINSEPMDENFNIYASNKRISGPIEVFIDDGKPFILWQEYAENSSTVFYKGNWQGSDIQFESGRIVDMHGFFKHELENEGLLVWNELVSDPFDSGNPKTLKSFYLSHEPIPAAIRLGSYTLHDAKINSQGEGHIVVSNEKEQPSSDTKVYLIPVQNNQIQIKQIDFSDLATYAEQVKKQEAALQTVLTIPGNFRGADMVLAAKIDSNGDGLILWRTFTDNTVKVIQVQNYLAVAGSERIAPLDFDAFLPNKLNVQQIILKLNKGNGYIAWPDGEQYQVLEVKDDEFQSEFITLSFPTSSECTLVSGGITTPAWDIDLDANGNGVASWPAESPEQFNIQQIQGFQFVSEPQVIHSLEKTSFCMTKIKSLDTNKALVTALSLETTENNNSIEQNKVIWSKKLDIN